MRDLSILACTALLVLVHVGCGGEKKLGETCDTTGTTEGECESGGVCGKPGDGTTGLQCLKVCTQQSDCPTDKDCNGVEGTSIKGCRLKSSTSGTDGGKVK